MEVWFEVCLSLVGSVAVCLLISLWFDVREIKGVVHRVMNDVWNIRYGKVLQGQAHDAGKLTAFQNMTVSEAITKLAFDCPVPSSDFEKTVSDLIAVLKRINTETDPAALAKLERAYWIRKGDV